MLMYFRSFEPAINFAKQMLVKYGKPVPVGHWQGLNVKGKPDMVSYEVTNIHFSCEVSPDIDELKRQIEPNLPWADDHFLERVGRVGLNPGEQYKNWPYYVRQKSNDVHRTEGGKFTHTYMERIWPKATESEYWKGKNPLGIRYEYGDLDDLVNLLIREPLTRQAFLPIWFPEDTGAVHGGRVPCTLGYHFMRRDDKLHIWYPIRSCDFIRHFRDDIYLACRLLLWVLDEVKRKDYDTWKDVIPGNLTMNIYSLHVFAAEITSLRG